MVDEIVIVQSSADTPPTPASPATPNDPPAEIVTAIHDDAVELGALRERVYTLEQRVITAEQRIDGLAGVTSVVVDTVEATAAAVETVAESVAEIESDPTPEIVADDTPDTPPGKTHWLHRSGKEWRGKE